MARIVPDGWASLEPTGAARREIDTLRELGAALPADCTVYHGVHWTRLEQGWSVWGEVDFIVVGPSGRVLLIEQRSGFVEETDDGLMHTVAGRPRSLKAQFARSIEALSQRFSQAVHGRSRLAVDYLLYLPDYQVKNPAIAGLTPERIVDAHRRGEFARAVRAGVGVPPDASAKSRGTGRAAPPPRPEPGMPAWAAAADVHRFLSDTLELVPDVSALIGREAISLNNNN
jgi:hypothetical protein